MKAGRALDLAIAQKVMNKHISDPNQIPRYSTVLEHAYFVLVQIKYSFGCYSKIKSHVSTSTGELSYNVQFSGSKGNYESESSELPEAICNCALKIIANFPVPYEPSGARAQPVKELTPTEIKDATSDIIQIIRNVIRTYKLPIKNQQGVKQTFEHLLFPAQKCGDLQKEDYENIPGILTSAIMNELEKNGFFLVKNKNKKND